MTRKMTAGSSSTERCMMQRAFWPGTQGVKLQFLAMQARFIKRQVMSSRVSMTDMRTRS